MACDLLTGLAITTLTELVSAVTAVRSAVPAHPIPILEIDVTNLFASLAHYVYVDNSANSKEYKAEYQAFATQLDQIEQACAALNAKGDGVTDDTCGIRAALAMVPDVSSYDCGNGPPKFNANGAFTGSTWTSGRPQGGAVVRFPPTDKFYRVTETVDVDESKSVALSGTASHGATIKLTDSADPSKKAATAKPIFHVLSPAADSIFQQVPRSFERLTLVWGGIQLDANLKWWTSIRDCMFHGVQGRAIECLKEANGDSDVVNVEIRRCVFSWCQGDVVIGAFYPQLTAWNIEDCVFTGNSGVDVSIDLGRVTVVNCEFYGKPIAASHVPYIHMARPAEMTRIVGCTLGDEASPPRDLIVIGKLAGKDANVNGYIDTDTGDVVLDACVFGGPLTTPVPGQSADSVVRARAPLQGVRFRSCTVWSFGALVAEDAVKFALQDAAALWSKSTRSALAQWNVSRRSFDNGVAHLNVRGRLSEVFTQGGRGFDVTGRPLRARLGLDAPKSRGGGNLLRDTDCPVDNFVTSSSWKLTDTSLTVTKADDSSAPNGQWAWKLTRQQADTFAAYIYQQIDLATSAAILDGQTAVLSVWLRADSDEITVAALDVALDANPDTGDAFSLGGSPERLIFLKKQWQRYSLRIERLPVRVADGAIATLDGTPVSKAVFDSLSFNIGTTTVSLRPEVRILHGRKGSPGWAKIGSSIWVSQPQLELGDVPSAYSPSMDGPSPHSPRPEQAVMLGGGVIGTATAPPTTGWYSKGDIFLNDSPVVGGWRGWVCTKAASDANAATWLPFGKIYEPGP